MTLFPADAVDPFIGCEPTDLPEPRGLAATWWWPKAQIGNTHPGACWPFGMVSASAYSGAYPTGYGLYDKNTDGIPAKLYDDYQASGFTHFHQSGTGAIQKYYNYVRVIPLIGPLDAIGQSWPIRDEDAHPGYYACTLDQSEPIRAELTVGPKSAVHRYTFPKSRRVNIALDLSMGGINIPFGKTVPTLADFQTLTPHSAQAEIVVEGVPLYVYIEHDAEYWKYGVWFDRKIVGGGKQLVFDHIRESTLKPFGIHFGGPTDQDQQVTLKLGFSWRSYDQARANLEAQGGTAFDEVRQRASSQWDGYLGKIKVRGGSDRQRTLFYTGLYHALIKPSDATNESPFWPNDGPFYFDLCTMWDIYKTQLPLMLTLYPDRGVDLVNSLLNICEQEGNFPIGYRMARGADRFFRQASALAHTTFVDAFYRKLPGIDWEFILTYMVKDLHRAYGEEFLSKGLVHPLTHQLDLAYGCYCTAVIAKQMDDQALHQRMVELAKLWRRAYDPDTGILADSTYYEGTKYNYSFRLLHDMAGRIEQAGGDERFIELLDRFFGYGAEPVQQLGHPPHGTAEAEGFALGRFGGLNNEPDMETPFAYHFAGRPDRTAEVVHHVLTYQFHTTRGGLPGNDDSGALSSWLVWAALGLFPVTGQPTVLLSTPWFDDVTVELPEGPLRITADRPDEAALYVQSVVFNGQTLDRAYLTTDELMQAGELHFVLGNTPSAWGTTQRPPSFAH